MLHEMFSGCYSQMASYPYTFTSYSHSCKILQPSLAAMVRMYSDAILFSIGASRMKTFIKNQRSSTNSGSLQTTVGSDAPDDACESASLTVLGAIALTVQKETSQRIKTATGTVNHESDLLSCEISLPVHVLIWQMNCFSQFTISYGNQ